MRPAAFVGAVVALAAAGTFGWWLSTRPGAPPPGGSPTPARGDTMRLVPAGVRVKVEVFNATGERGIARRAMLYLRSRGFDVVTVGNAPQRLDSSLVIDRSGHHDWAALAARAVGASRVEARADSSRYVDLTILIGAAFRLPPQVLYP